MSRYHGDDGEQRVEYELHLLLLCERLNEIRYDFPAAPPEDPTEWWDTMSELVDSVEYYCRRWRYNSAESIGQIMRWLRTDQRRVVAEAVGVPA